MVQSCMHREYGNLAELADDFLAEGIEELCPQPRPIDTIDQLGENLSAHHTLDNYEENELVTPFDEHENQPSIASYSGESSNLRIYFKTVGRFSLLKEEEATLAKQIKEREHTCINLIIKWKHNVINCKVIDAEKQK